jgi:hypothetical protein
MAETSFGREKADDHMTKSNSGVINSAPISGFFMAKKGTLLPDPYVSLLTQLSHCCLERDDPKRALEYILKHRSSETPHDSLQDDDLKRHSSRMGPGSEPQVAVREKM